MNLQESERLSIADAAERVRNLGYVRLQKLLSEARVRDLEAEAADLYPGSDRYVHDIFDIGGQSVVTSPATFRLATGGPALRRVWASAALIRMLSGVVGGALTPTRCSYNFYEKGDHIGLHVDVDECQVTVTFGLWDVDPVVMYPEFREMSSNELLELAIRTSGMPQGGTPLPMGLGAAIVMRGHTTPHRRPVYTGNLAGVGALCYRVGKEGG